MSEPQKFQEFVLGIREDVTIANNICWLLDWKLVDLANMGDFNYRQNASEVREWIYDVLLDKIYDIDSKITKFLTDLSLQELQKKVSIQEITKYVNEIIYDKKGM